MTLVALTRQAAMRLVACGGGIGTRSIEGPATVTECWTCEGDFTHVRVGVMNDRPRAVGVGPIGLAPVGHPNEKSARRTTAGMVVPPAACDWQPAFAFSEWTPIRSIPRSDAGPGRLLQIRVAMADGMHARGPGANADPCRFTGRCYRTSLDDGRMTRPNSGAIYTVQWRTTVPGATVQMVGDSIGQGVGSTNGYANFGLLACAAVSSERLPVHFLQSAVSGEKSADFIRAAHHDLYTGPVSIACIQTWSGNDVHASMSPALARSAADAAWHRARAYGEALRAQGGVPIYMSAVPQKRRCPTPALEAARMSSASRCHALAARGEFVLDLNGILGDGATPVDYRPAFLDDHFHPNDAGQDAVARRLAPLLRTTVGATG